MIKNLIERVELSSAASSITFSAIPQTYNGLYLIASLREATGTDAEVDLKFNGNATGYSWVYLIGNGSTSGSTRSTGTHIRAISNPSNATVAVFGNLSVTIPNYTSSNYKAVSVDSVSENNLATNAYQRMTTGLWSNTAAITSITLAPYTGNWEQYSSASLYGVTTGSDGITTVS